MNEGVIQDESGVRRCWWCGTDPLYIAYHDHEWGRPVTDDRRLFEKICLEGFQAGLSWLTILKKREHFRQAFLGFELVKIARMNQRTVTRLVTNPGIVRHRGKIESTINNARQALQLLEEWDSLADYFWQFQPENPPSVRAKSDIASITPESKQLSRDLKARGWTYVGPTTCYAFMQSMGLVNDHLVQCHVYAQVQQTRHE